MGDGSRTDGTFEAVLEALGTPVLLVDGDTTISWISKTAAAVFGPYSDGDLVGRRLGDFVEETAVRALTHGPEGRHMRAALVASPRAAAVELELVSRAVQGRPGARVMTMCAPAADDNATGGDSPERWWRLFTQATSNMLWNWDFSNDEVERSLAFETAFGYSHAEIERAIGWWVDRLHEDDKQRVLATFNAALQGGENRTGYEYRFRRHDGTYAHIRDVVFILRDASGQGIRALGAMTDITAQKALEEERARADRLASVGFLAAGVAHDFNNLVMGIQLNTELLESSLTDPEDKACLEQIDAACAAMESLATRMLTFSRGGKPERSLVNAAEVVEDATRLVTSGANVAVDLLLPTNRLLARLDRGQFGQAIGNVILNAVQAMPQGGRIEVDVSHCRPPEGLDPAESYFAVTIADDGPGIAADVLPKIFDLYFTTRPTGTGMGLALAHSIIRRHGGEVKVRSEVGKGTVFQLVLPTGTDQSELATRSSSPSRGRILVVEDEGIVRRAVRTAIERLGFDVVEASTGSQAVETIERWKRSERDFAFAIFDLTLPDRLNGLDVATVFRQCYPGVPCALMTGYAEQDLEQRLAELDIQVKLTKPTSVEQLQATVRRFTSSPRPTR